MTASTAGGHCLRPLMACEAQEPLSLSTSWKNLTVQHFLCPLFGTKSQNFDMLHSYIDSDTLFRNILKCRLQCFTLTVSLQLL